MPGLMHWILLPVRVLRRFRDENLDQTSASLAFTTLLALVPMVALMLSLLAVLPALTGLLAHVDQLLVQHLLPESSAGTIANKILYFSQRAARVTWLGGLMMGLTAFLLFNTIERVFGRIWQERQRRPLLQRLGLFLLMLLAWPLLLGGMMALVSYAVTLSLGLINEPVWVRQAAIKGGSWLLLAIFFGGLYAMVPSVRVRLLPAMSAGLLAAAGFVGLQRGFELYLAHVPSYTAVYGAFAAVPVFLLWLYLSWAVVLLGALVCAEFGASAGSSPRRSAKLSTTRGRAQSK